MAKYTELFSEYVASGYELPSEFSLIEGFEDLFKMHFCDKEIGFETEAIFAMKLQEKSTLYIPLYADRIAHRATALLDFDAPVKIYYDDIDATITNGAEKGKTTELPFNASSATPSVINETDEHENVEDRTAERRESGLTPDELIRKLDYLNKSVRSLLDELLKEFDGLFMKVY